MNEQLNGVTMNAIDSESAFHKLVQNLNKDDISQLLLTWNESELDEAENEIVIYVDSRAYGPRTGGANKVDKSELINWLNSEAPFDTKTYGEDIRDDHDWVSLINRAREAIK
jgi:hypothetical protein